MMMSSAHIIPICGFPVREGNSDEIARDLLANVNEKRRYAVFFANPNFIVKCSHLRQRMQAQQVTILNDGIGMDMAAWLMRRKPFKENLNGTDFIPYLFRQSDRKLRLYLLGGTYDVVFEAAKHINVVFGHRVVGLRDGYDSLRDRVDTVNSINTANPDILLVALGNPSQEEWILKNLENLNCPLVLAVGGLFDFWSGAKPRAPAYIRKCRLEWLFRLCLEPRRLGRRYTIDVIRFLVRCAHDQRGASPYRHLLTNEGE
ncbi:WecB/TagA/CpsF family glycosyltransferase [Noviherbaspirillum malthae]|uniref:WecB/TagA/CpsF family glycosyltransferase n=1 Tax=Noviherbaspirillum malthae TaxID=1260987 RepID=UPI001E467601|nr:WecB/TagA/CpsF family glycosyltransferase [Noviherbaspirillum malthae]